MKKYTKPEINITSIRSEDIITISDLVINSKRQIVEENPQTLFSVIKF